MPFFSKASHTSAITGFAFVAFAVIILAGGEPAMARTIRFAPLPMENHETLVKQHRGLILFLEGKLGVDIAVVHGDDAFGDLKTAIAIPTANKE